MILFVGFELLTDLVLLQFDVWIPAVSSPLICRGWQSERFVGKISCLCSSLLTTFHLDYCPSSCSRLLECSVNLWLTVISIIRAPLRWHTGKLLNLTALFSETLSRWAEGGALRTGAPAGNKELHYQDAGLTSRPSPPRCFINIITHFTLMDVLLHPEQRKLQMLQNLPISQSFKSSRNIWWLTECRLLIPVHRSVGGLILEVYCKVRHLGLCLGLRSVTLRKRKHKTG